MKSVFNWILLAFSLTTVWANEENEYYYPGEEAPYYAEEDTNQSLRGSWPPKLQFGDPSYLNASCGTLDYSCWFHRSVARIWMMGSRNYQLFTPTGQCNALRRTFSSLNSSTESPWWAPPSKKTGPSFATHPRDGQRQKISPKKRKPKKAGRKIMKNSSRKAREDAIFRVKLQLHFWTWHNRYIRFKRRVKIAHRLMRPHLKKANLRFAKGKSLAFGTLKFAGQKFCRLSRYVMLGIGQVGKLFALDMLLRAVVFILAYTNPARTNGHLRDVLLRIQRRISVGQQHGDELVNADSNERSGLLYDCIEQPWSYYNLAAMPKRALYLEPRHAAASPKPAEYNELEENDAALELRAESTFSMMRDNQTQQQEQGQEDPGNTEPDPPSDAARELRNVRFAPQTGDVTIIY